MFVSPVHRGIAAPSGIIEDGLIHRWNMDEGSGSTLNDPYGSNHATLSGNYIWTTGMDGQRNALDFNGGTEGALTSQIHIGKIFTVTFNCFNRGGSTLILGNTANWIPRMSSTVSRIQYRRGGLSTNLSGTETVDAWFSIAMTCNTNDLERFVDGLSEDTGVNTNAADSVADDIGGSGGVYHFDGIMEDLRLYNRVLTPAEIGQIAAGTG